MALARQVEPKDVHQSAREVLNGRALVFVGLMGAGKSVIGRMTAKALGIPFIDSDAEIEHVSRMSIAELFEVYGEPEFRALEARVIARLLKGGPRVLSTGGGAFINNESRTLIRQQAVSVWLKADLDVLWDRVRRRSHRPLLKTPDPKQTLALLMENRYPIYGVADVTVHSRDVCKDVVVEETLAALIDWSRRNEGR